MFKPKKLLAGAVSAALMFGMAAALPREITQKLGSGIEANAYYTYGDYQYEIHGSSVTIKKYTGADDDVTIPSIIDGKPVTVIGSEAFALCTSFASITIPESVTSIGGYAFYHCENLTSITIPDSVTSIEHYAFAFCESFKSITIPDSVTDIGYQAFLGCTSLTSIDVEASNTSFSSIDGVLYNKNKTKLICCPGGKTSITIPNSVTSIRELAFEMCTSLKSVTLPDNVTSIGYNAFSGCTSLTSITIPNSVTSIGSYAF